MTNDLRRFVGFLVLAVFGGSAAVVLLPKLLGFAAGPEAELVTRLKQSERAGLEVPVKGHPATIKSRRHEYQRLSVEVNLEEQRADVAGTLDFEGTLGLTRVHSLGSERVRFTLEEGEWEAKDGFAPQLGRVVAALERRRVELERGLLSEPSRWGISRKEAAALLAIEGRSYQAQDWFIRLEPGSARVTEEFRVQGTLPERPVDDKGRTDLSLFLEGQEFFFQAKGE